MPCACLYLMGRYGEICRARASTPACPRTGPRRRSQSQPARRSFRSSAPPPPSWPPQPPRADRRRAPTRRPPHPPQNTHPPTPLSHHLCVRSGDNLPQAPPSPFPLPLPSSTTLWMGSGDISLSLTQPATRRRRRRRPLRRPSLPPRRRAWSCRRSAVLDATLVLRPRTLPLRVALLSCLGALPGPALGPIGQRPYRCGNAKGRCIAARLAVERTRLWMYSAEGLYSSAHTR